MPEYRELFKEDYTDIVEKTDRDTEQYTYYEKIVRYYNYKFNRHISISDYELWMFSKLAYSNDGINQKFIDRFYNQKYYIDHFVSESDGLQFYVIKSRLTKDLIIAFRGTDEWVDWLTNIQILSAKKKQFDTATKYLESIFKEHTNHYIYLCGHSLGGALAQQMYVYYYSITKLKLMKAVTFNSAGIRYRNENAYVKLPIYNYIIAQDIVGNSTGYHYGSVHYVKPKEITNRLDPLKLFTHTLDQFTFNTDGSVSCVDHLV
jgi:Protein of unknown function (DUF2974)